MSHPHRDHQGGILASPHLDQTYRVNMFEVVKEDAMPSRLRCALRGEATPAEHALLKHRSLHGMNRSAILVASHGEQLGNFCTLTSLMPYMSDPTLAAAEPDEKEWTAIFVTAKHGMENLLCELPNSPVARPTVAKPTVLITRRAYCTALSLTNSIWALRCNHFLLS